MVCEPTILFAYGRYHMWYFGGGKQAAIGYAESADGVTWHKRQGPVVGLGTGGFQPMAMRNFVVRQHGVYYLFFASDNSDRALHVATSHDGIHFKTFPRPILRPSAWNSGMANTDVWVENGRWFMLYEAWTTHLGIWRMALAEGNNPYAWRKVTGPLASLQVGVGMYGGPAVLKIDRVYHLWYHAALKTSLPTDIYHATSTDLIHWRRVADGPVVPRSLLWEVDQTADPDVIVRGHRLWMYYAGMDNVSGVGQIGLATTALPSRL